MDQSRDARTSPPGTLRLVKNCRVRSGRLQKRCGSAAIANGANAFTDRIISDLTTNSRPVEHPAFIGRIGSQRIAAASSGWAFTFDSDDVPRYAGEFSAALPERKRFGIPASLPTTPAGPQTPAVAVNADGMICAACGFGTELRVTVESADGELLASETATVGTGNLVVRVIPMTHSSGAASFLVVYQDIGATTVYYTYIVPGTNGVTSISIPGSTLVTLTNASSKWDISAYDGTTWFLVYQSGATTVTVAEYDMTPTVGSTVTFSTTNNLTFLSIWADTDTDRVWVGLVDDPAGTPVAQYRVYTNALALEFGPTSLSTTTAVGPPLFGPLYKRTPVAGDAFGVIATASGTRYFLRAVVVEAGSKTREVTQANNVFAISKPDAQQRVWAATWAPGSNFAFTRVCLLRLTGDEFAGDWSFDPPAVVELSSPEFESPGSSYHPVADISRAFQAVSVSSEASGGKAYFAFSRVLTTRTNASSATEPTMGVDVYEYTRYNQEPRHQMVPAGRVGFVAGQPTELWGLIGQVGGHPFTGGVEVGFPHRPSIISDTKTPSGSGLAAGSYVYYLVQQWVDDEGNRHLSAPSAPYTVTLTEPSSVRIDVARWNVGQRPNWTAPASLQEPRTLLYRTQNSGEQAQEVPISLDTAFSPPRFTDTVADSIIEANEFIYTGGGVLPNVLAPSCRYLAVSEERLWCGGLWDSNIIECSKIRVPNEPYNFTGDASHQVVIPGEVSGLAYMDGQVCVFTEDAIYLVSGDGPNDQGAGGFAPPRALVRGVGCPREQSASILETELGILFRSELGFYIIPRGYGTPEFIGDPVHDEDELVLSAATTTTGEHRLARFLVCASGETYSDTVLTFDLTERQWVRDEYNVNGASITGQGFSEIGEWPDGLALFSYGLQRTDNLKIIWAESESLTGDAGAAGVGVTTFISSYVQTAWQYGPWGPCSWGRLESVVLMFEAAGACGLNLTVEAGDSGSDVAFAQDATQWTIAASSDDQYRYLTVKFPNCSAYRITLYDAATSGNSSGLRLLALGAVTTPVGGLRPPMNDTERQ